MSTTTVINGNSYSSFDSAAISSTSSSAAAGAYTAMPPYGEPPRLGAWEYEELPVTYAGLNDIGFKILGRRGRQCVIDMVAVGANKGAAVNNHDAVLANFSPLARITLVLPSTTSSDGWKLARGSGEITGWFTIGTAYCAKFQLVLKQFSTSN